MSKSQEKNPSNADIMAVLRPLVRDVAELMQDKHEKIIADKAIAKWVQDHPQQAPYQPSMQSQAADQQVNQQILKYLGIALGIISAMVILYGQLHGVATK